jgi:hypothetical protein
VLPDLSIRRCCVDRLRSQDLSEGGLLAALGDIRTPRPGMEHGRVEYRRALYNQSKLALFAGNQIG